MDKFGFIGCGNMGYPMLRGVKNVFGSDFVTFTTASAERRELIKKETGVSYVSDNVSVVTSCKYIILAIKPQKYEEVFKEIKNCLTKEHIVISIAVGYPIENIKKTLGSSVRVVRAMPNTPALVGEGMSGVCFSEDTFTEEEKETINRFFCSFGKYEIFDEKLMDAVACASGSTPAYVYMFIEALADSVVKYGIPRNKAYDLVSQTVLGAAKMVLETKEHPGKLKDQVCSPGGTTIAGVAALEENGFRNAVIKATDACYAKANNMKK